MRDRNGRPRCSTFELGQCALAPAQIGGLFFSTNVAGDANTRRADVAGLIGDRPAAQTIRVNLRAKKAQAVLSGEGEGRTPGPRACGENPVWGIAP
jgi:hypothetical protein